MSRSVQVVAAGLLVVAPAACSSGYVPALYNLAILRTPDGDTAGAIALYRKAVAGDPKIRRRTLPSRRVLPEVGRQQEGQVEVAVEARSVAHSDGTLPRATTTAT